jgi:hypothetical protein
MLKKDKNIFFMLLNKLKQNYEKSVRESSENGPTDQLYYDELPNEEEFLFNSDADPNDLN